MIETNAITIGTTARNDANTNASTASAPSAPSIASSRSPGPSESCAAVLGQRVEARQVHRLAGDRRALERRARRLLGLRVLAERRVGVGLRVDDRERRAAVLREEGPVAGRGVRREPRAGQRPLELLVDLPQVGLHLRRVGARALRQRHDREQRRGVAAGAAVVLGDGDVGLPALLVGHGELGIEGVRGGSGGRDAGDRQDDPAEHDGALVGEDPAGQRGHGATSGAAKQIVPRRNNLYQE